MFVKGLSTRHTAVGTFRFGVVYDIDEKDTAIRKHVLPLLEKPNAALKKISKSEAEKDKSNPTQFTPEALAPDANSAAVDLREALAMAKASQKGAEKKSDEWEKQATDTQTLLDQLQITHDQAAEAHSSALEEVQELRDRLIEAESSLKQVQAAKDEAVEMYEAAMETIVSLENSLDKSLQTNEQLTAPASKNGQGE